MFRSKVMSLSVSCLLVVFAGIVGCGKSGPTVADVNPTNIKRLHSAYMMFWGSNANRGPKDEQEFRNVLTNDPGAKLKLERIGVDPSAVADMFIGDRDQKPLVVRYGVNGPGDPPIIFEAEGAEGSRLVAFATPRELSAEEYDQALAGKMKIERSVGGDF